MTNQEKEQLWNCIMKMRSMPWRKPRGGEYNWDYASMRELFDKLVVYADNDEQTAAWRLLTTGKYKYMIYPWYKSQLYNCIAFGPPPTYQIVPDTDTIPDGGNLPFTVTTTDVPDGTVLYWTILPLAPTPAVSADFVGGIMNGSLTITANSGGDTIFTVDNILYKPNTTFAIQVRTGSISGPVVDTSGTFTIDRGAPPLRTVWDNILNVPVADPTSVSDWQTFYDASILGGFGVTFGSVVVVGNTVDIYASSPTPYGTATVADGLFNSNLNLYEFVDFGGWVSVTEDRSFGGTSQLRYLYLPGPITAFIGRSFYVAGYGGLVTSIGTYPTCTVVGSFAFSLSSVFKELYLPNATTVGANAFQQVSVNLDVLDISGFINTGSLNLVDYVSLLYGATTLTVDQSWQSQVLTVSFIDYATCPITNIAPGNAVKFVFNNAPSIQYDLGGTSTGTYDFTAGAADVLLYTVGGPDLTPFSTTYFYEITGTGITQADFIQPTSISGTFIPTSSTTVFNIEPELSAAGKSFVFSVYQGSDNTGTLIINRSCNII